MIMIFGTNDGYDKLSKLIKNQPRIANQSHDSSIFLSLQQNIFQRFLSPYLAKVFKFCINLEDGQVYCVKENQDAYVYLAFLFNVPFISSSHSYVMHIDILVKDYLT